MNVQLASRVIKLAHQMGVQDFCVCAGARNAPLVIALQNANGINALNFFDERSAGFFAVGRSQREARPVAIVTTSGTAVAELLPAVVEAFYQGLPLLLITADRPRRYRGSGAPQSIEQNGIFSTYVEFVEDLEKNDELKKTLKWSLQKPAQINVCFDEPLLDDEVTPLQLQSMDRPSVRLTVPHSQIQSLHLTAPVVIVGPLKESAREDTIQALLAWDCPFYLESTSGLRSEPRLQKNRICTGDAMVEQILQRGWAKALIRVGGVPTLRSWRNLEEKYTELPVVVACDLSFTGLSRPVTAMSSLSVIRKNIQVSPMSTAIKEQIFALDHKMRSQLEADLASHPKSEPALFWQLSKTIKKTNLYLGNSLPIREWDLVDNGTDGAYRVFANRGANGIDGQISSFLGWARSGEENLAVLGDLTALYDLSALWIDRHLQQGRYRIIVINNGGGQIFKNMFKNESFLNRHEIQFEHWAKMWNWSYVRWQGVVSDISTLPDKCIIEICPLELETDQFWKRHLQK